MGMNKKITLKQFYEVGKTKINSLDRMIKIYLALVVGMAIASELDLRERHPFQWCIMEIEIKLIDVPVFGRLCDFLDDISDRWSRRK